MPLNKDIKPNHKMRIDEEKATGKNQKSKCIEHETAVMDN